MQIQIDQTRLKSMARTLQACVAETPKRRFRYTQALDALARAFGYADWNTAEARLPADASPPPEPASGPADLGQQVYVLRSTHDYDTDTIVCTGFEAVTAQLDQLLAELDDNGGKTDRTVQEAACRLLEQGWFEIADTTIELVAAPVAPAPAGALETSAHAALARTADLLRTVDRFRLPPMIRADLPELEAAHRQAVRDLVARRPDARDLLEWQLSKLHPAPWRLVEADGTPQALVDATGHTVEALAAGDRPRATALIAAVAAQTAASDGGLPEGCREVINAFLAAGGTHDDLWRMINADSCPDGADDASGELEINGIDGGFAVIVDTLGVLDTVQWLIDTTRGDRELYGHIDFERLVEPAVARLSARGIAAYGDHDALWEGLIDAVDDAVSHLAAEAANAAESDAAAEEAIEATWQIASKVNNQDVPGQLRFLIQEHGSIDAVARLIPDPDPS